MKYTIRGLVLLLLLCSYNTVVGQSLKERLSNHAAETHAERVYQSAAKMPSFPGGVAGMMEWITKNIRYPAAAIEKGAEGKVKVQFVVERDGSLTNATIVSNSAADPDLGEEALRLVYAMPKWKPGENEAGAKIRVYYTIPVTFKLQTGQTSTRSTGAKASSTAAQKQREMEKKAKEEAERQRLADQKAKEEAERQLMIARRLNALDSVPILRLLVNTAAQTEAEVGLFDYTVVIGTGKVTILANSSKSTSDAYKAFWKEANKMLTVTGSKRNATQRDTDQSTGYDFKLTNAYVEFDSKSSSTYHFRGKTATWGARERSVDYVVRLKDHEDAYTFEMMDSLMVAVEKNLCYFVDDVFRLYEGSNVEIKALIPTPSGEDYDYLSTYMNGSGADLLGFDARNREETRRWYIPHLQNDWDAGLPLYEITLTGVGAADKKSILAKAKEYGYKVSVKTEANDTDTKAKSNRSYSTRTRSNPLNIRVGTNFGGGRPGGGRR